MHGQLFSAIQPAAEESCISLHQPTYTMPPAPTNQVCLAFGAAVHAGKAWEEKCGIYYKNRSAAPMAVPDDAAHLLAPGQQGFRSPHKASKKDKKSSRAGSIAAAAAAAHEEDREVRLDGISDILLAMLSMIAINLLKIPW